MSETTQFDAIVIGSGVSGGWAAKELTEKGLKVLMLDRGRTVEHGIDYTTEGRPAFEQPYRGRWPRGLREEKYFQQYPAGPDTAHFFNDDSKYPYVFDTEKPFYWVRAGVMGGKSLLWGRKSFRWSEIDFRANEWDGHGIAWPIGYDDIAPWYSHVEKFVGIAGEKLDLPQLPDSDYTGTIDLNIAEKHFKNAIKDKFDRVATIGRTANLMEDRPEQGRTKCQYRNQCPRGCSYGANFTTQSTTLPAARATGNLTIRNDAQVTSLDYDAKSKRVTGVNVTDMNTKATTTYRARIVFVCASCIASTAILLNSRSDDQPNGLGNNHDVVGRYLMDHTWGTGATGYLPMYKEYVEYGRRPTSMYIPRWQNLGKTPDEDNDFVRGYNYQSWGGGRSGPQDYSGFGAKLKQQLRVPGAWKIPLWGFGECLPHKDNRMMLDPNKKDASGMPLVKFDMVWRENDLKITRRIVKEAVAMLEAAGCVDIEVRPEPQAPGFGIHEMGTARMGDDPREAVLNKWNQMHVAPNVFITDGASMTSSSTVNPSLTFMALTARAADRAVTLMKDGAI